MAEAWPINKWEHTNTSSESSSHNAATWPKRDRPRNLHRRHRRHGATHQQAPRHRRPRPRPHHPCRPSPRHGRGAATGNCRTTGVRAPDRRSDPSAPVVQPHSTITMADGQHASIGQCCYRIPVAVSPCTDVQPPRTMGPRREGAPLSIGHLDHLHTLTPRSAWKAQTTAATSSVPPPEQSATHNAGEISFDVFFFGVNNCFVNRATSFTNVFF